ncbi:TetR/AcrR family transcriptional regulator [Desertimonas flava]|uniref:TetR/AcrR family transcriptional regulator n=1 Tax=Desertimonas flava TaxID=2064846 RepID=UPI0013C3F297|nr:TetR/AcrR family transcriptional regulator [Desertimonas flava]
MPRDGSANRQRILDAAERLVIDNGFNATTLDQVIAAAGTSKGAFFHHFDGKAALARALVERYAAGDVAHLEGALEATAGIDDPAERALAFVQVFVDGADELMQEQSSCLYAAMLAERQLIVDGTTSSIRDAATAWRVEFAKILRAAFDARAPVPDIDVDDLSDHLFATFEGGFVLARALEDPSAMRSQLVVYRQLLSAVLAA